MAVCSNCYLFSVVWGLLFKIYIFTCGLGVFNSFTFDSKFQNPLRHSSDDTRLMVGCEPRAWQKESHDSNHNQ